MNCIFDAHCDTIYELDKNNSSLMKNTLQLDIERMERFDTYIQIFAAFVDKKTIKCSPMEHCRALIEKYKSSIEENKQRISVIESLDDLENAIKNKGAYSILAIEGGEALGGCLDAVLMYYKLGVRLITLTWNYTNELGGGITDESGGGLTEFGRRAVEMMESIGIVVDVSHLSERGFFDVCEIARYPFVASHSCVRSLCSHKRNLSDEQIRAIIGKRGCIGVNFFPDFLSDSKICTADEIYRHIEYILDLRGEDCVGLGSDFDGVSKLPSDINGVQDMQKIADGIKKRVASDIVADKILYGNFLRIFKNSLKRGEKIEKI